MRKKVEPVETKTINKLYKDSFKKKLVQQLEAGTISQKQARLQYGVTKSVLLYWMTKYGAGVERAQEMKWREKRRQLCEMTENMKLQRELRIARIEADLHKTIIEIANMRYGINLKKNYGL